MRGVTNDALCESLSNKFLLTRLMRGVTDSGTVTVEGRKISTHTPHARRDQADAVYLGLPDHFYSHASCEA